MESYWDWLPQELHELILYWVWRLGMNECLTEWESNQDKLEKFLKNRTWRAKLNRCGHPDYSIRIFRNTVVVYDGSPAITIGGRPLYPRLVSRGYANRGKKIAKTIYERLIEENGEFRSYASRSTDPYYRMKEDKARQVRIASELAERIANKEKWQSKQEALKKERERLQALELERLMRWRIQELEQIKQQHIQELVQDGWVEVPADERFLQNGFWRVSPAYLGDAPRFFIRPTN